MTSSKHTILITGYNGFVGRNLTAALGEYRLNGLDIHPGQYVEKHYGWENLEQIANVDCIVHLAGKAHDVANASDPQSYFDINYGLTKRIFDHFLSSSAEKFIFFSSVKAVADTLGRDALAEDFTPDPLTPYGKSKLAAEEYIRSVQLPEGKKVYILRPSMIHGPGNKGNLNLLYKFVRKGIPYPLGAFDNLRSFTSVANVIFIIRELLEKPIIPGVYHVCDDEPISTSELIRLIAASCQRSPRILDIPPGLVNALASLGDLLHLPFNGERLKKLTESYVVSNKKLKSALGIEHLPVKSRDGFEQTLRSFSGK
jgi:nucleoside-diphosphate-sugar epimerase